MTGEGLLRVSRGTLVGFGSSGDPFRLQLLQLLLFRRINRRRYSGFNYLMHVAAAATANPAAAAMTR